MKRLSWISAAAALLLSAGASFADISYPTNFSATYTPSSGTPTFGFGGFPGGLGALDGSSGVFALSGGAPQFPTTGTMVVTANFGGLKPGFDQTVVISNTRTTFGGGATSFTLQSIQWSYNLGADTATFDIPDIVFNDFDSYKIPNSQNQGSYTTTGGFNFDLIDTLVLTFGASSTLGGTFTIDAVSNPEPATMALFGLGALGLGGMAWRRRTKKARKTA